MGEFQDTSRFPRIGTESLLNLVLADPSDRIADQNREGQQEHPPSDGPGSRVWWIHELAWYPDSIGDDKDHQDSHRDQQEHRQFNRTVKPPIVVEVTGLRTPSLEGDQKDFENETNTKDPAICGVMLKRFQVGECPETGPERNAC